MKTTKKTSKKPGPKKRPAPAVVHPNAIRHPGGRPKKLNRALIDEWCGHIGLCLHMTHVAALCGVSNHYIEWLKKGRADAIANKESIEREFSERTRAKLAEIQQQELGSLAVYQRMAEGWSPSCDRCRAMGRPCGKHKKNLRLAADLAKWKLQHRFPREWNTSNVSLDLAGEGSVLDAQVPGSAGDEGGLKTIGAAMVMYIPQRRADLE